jgi:hypothetical protein
VSIEEKGPGDEVDGVENFRDPATRHYRGTLVLIIPPNFLKENLWIQGIMLAGE